MAWLLLTVAGLLEVIWATALKHSDGLTRLWPSVVGIVGAVTSFALLAMAMKSLPAGTGYAVWVGIGMVGVALTGIVAGGEPVSATRLCCLSAIVVGVVGLSLTEATISGP
ncbi:DMT family transporter [Mycobacterium sp. smrl_JER01]|uniref:DMT family transporter n=1 Tax=Mycobacterium sp. smrl_JER01 TaxID=3402633 RepID=UPI003AC80BDF